MNKYDDYAWHYEGDFPVDLAHEQGATHIGFFFSWCLSKDFVDPSVINEFAEDINAVKKKRYSGTEFLLDHYQGRLLSTQLTEEGNAFVKDYYDEDSRFSKDVANYFDDYIQAHHIAHPDQFYYVEDTWENYYEIKEIINHRYEQWKSFV